MSELKPGRELDALVASKVMGIKINGPDELLYPFPGTGPRIPLYSTDIAAAWRVVEKLRSLGFGVVISLGSVTAYVSVRVDDAKGTEVGQSYSEDEQLNVAHCICLAALKAVGAL